MRDLRVTIMAGLALGLTIAWSGAPAEAAPAKAAKAVAAKAAAGKNATSKTASGKTASGKTAKLNAAARKPAPLAPSTAVVEVADWVINSGDSRELPFMVIDKVAAQVFVFEADGELRGGGPALLGLAQGDSSVPGIGSRKLSAIRPGERTTPAGRFIAAYGPAAGGKVLWVDYANAISIHPVVTSNPKEQRVKRLQSRSAKDNRITYGCINVSAGFYENVVRKTFTGTRGVVYILPETEPLESVFPALGGTHVRTAAGPAPDRASELGVVKSQAAGDAASDVVQVGGDPAFDPIIELGTARAAAAGVEAVDDAAFDLAIQPEPDPEFDPETAGSEPFAHGASDEAQAASDTRPAADPIIELEVARSAEASDAASDATLLGPSP